MSDWNGLITGFALGVLSAAAWRSCNLWRSGLKKKRWQRVSKEIKMVLVVRPDLNMGKGKIAAQCCHATLGCYRIASKVVPELVTGWEAAGQPKIVLRMNTSGEEALYELLEIARSRGIVGTVIRDAGHTQVERGTATVLGLGPCDSLIIDLVTAHLKLL